MMSRTGMQRLFAIMGLSLVAGWCASDAHGVVIAKDTYEVGPGNYTTGGLNGQSGAAEVGFAGTWAVSSANLGADTISLDGEGTGKGKFTASTAFSDFDRSAERLLAGTPLADPPGNTFYMSHLVNAGGLAPQGEDEANGYAMVGFGSFVDGGRLRDETNFLLGAFTGFVPSAAAPGAVDLVIRSRTGPTVPGAVTDEVLVADAANNTFQVVMALEYNNPGDTIRYWLNPTDFSNGEAGLTASSAASGSIAGFQLGAVSDMDRLNVETFGFDHSFFWDNSILATEVADLPEPASLGLLALGAVAMRRRRA